MSSALTSSSPTSQPSLASPSLSHSETNGIPSTSNSPVLPTRELVGDDLLSALVHQLEWYFSKENLVKDAFLLSQLSSGGVPVDVICSFRKVQALTSDKTLVLAAMRKCRSLQLDATQTLVKPITRAERNVLILRDMPSSLSTETVGAIFAVDGCPGEVRSLRSEVGDCWFVQFESEDQCMDTALWLTGQQFQGRAIHARVKSVVAPSAVLVAVSREQPRAVGGDGQPGSIYTGGSVTTPLMSPTGSGTSTSTSSTYSSSHMLPNPNMSPSAASMPHPSAMYYQTPPPSSYSPYQYPSPYFLPSYPNQPLSAYQLNGYLGQPYPQQQQQQQQASGAGQYGGLGRGNRPNGHYGQGGKRYVAHHSQQQGQPFHTAVNANISQSSAINGKAGSPSAAGKQPPQQQQPQLARKKKGAASPTDGSTQLPNGHSSDAADLPYLPSVIAPTTTTITTAPTSISVYDQPGVSPAGLSSSLSASVSSPSIPLLQPLRPLSATVSQPVNSATGKGQSAPAAAAAGVGKKKRKSGAAGETTGMPSPAPSASAQPAPTPAAVLDTSQFPALSAGVSDTPNLSDSSTAALSPAAPSHPLTSSTPTLISSPNTVPSSGATVRSPGSPAIVGSVSTVAPVKSSGWASIVTASQHAQQTSSKPVSSLIVAASTASATTGAVTKPILPPPRVSNEKREQADSKPATTPAASSTASSIAASSAASSSNISPPSTSSASSSSSLPSPSATLSHSAPPVMNYARMVGSMSVADAAKLEEQVKAARAKKAQHEAAQTGKDDTDKENKGETKETREGESRGDGAVEGELTKEQLEKRAKRAEAAKAERREREEERERERYMRYQAKKQLQAAGGEQEERQNHTGERRDRERMRLDRTEKGDTSVTSGHWREQNGVGSATGNSEERSWRRADRRVGGQGRQALDSCWW